MKADVTIRGCGTFTVFDEDERVTGGHICATNNLKDTCDGDSGGSLFLRVRNMDKLSYNPIEIYIICFYQ